MSRFMTPVTYDPALPPRQTVAHLPISSASCQALRHRWSSAAACDKKICPKYRLHRCMSWLTEFVRPKIRTLFARREVPENLWHQCPACQQMIFHRDLQTNLKVCPHCGHHMRVGALERLGMTFDEGSFTRIELPKVPVDPLRFRAT